MNGRTPTKDEDAWLAAIVEIGCIVCMNEFNLFTPGSPHHIDGSKKPGAHKKTICLCWRHHQEGSNNPQWVSRHPWKPEFESRYGTEQELLSQTEQLVAA